MAENTDKQMGNSLEDRRKQGRALRKQTPRSSHGSWAPAPDRPNPISLLQEQDKGRLQHLLPIKYSRMLASPFAFLRGSAVVMASDLATTPVSGIETIICGDAHLANFGVFASPERTLVFDINDFDEAYPGPWEWDLKRLATSAVVAGRENGFSKKVCRNLAIAVAKTYQLAVQQFAKMSVLDLWYYHVKAEDVLALFETRSSSSSEKSAKKMVQKAQSRTREQTLEKLTHFVGGRRRIVSDPPLLVPLGEIDSERIVSKTERERMSEKQVADTWSQYLDSLPDERRFLLQRFHLADAALRVGGVGSVGTRCTIVLLEAEAEEDALILQLKEAGPSALEPFLTKRNYRQHAERVVTGQRLMQATSDIFLGWHSSSLTGIDYYWRQLKDMKGSLDVEGLDEDGFRAYVSLCSWCLARAHARTGDEAIISGYLGRNDTFADAIGEFAVAYADQNERDYQALVAAVKSGKIAAEMGI